MGSLRDVYPPVYRPLLDPFFDRSKVEETRATCDDCAMCDKGQPSPVEVEYFRPDTKCCTFFPQLPNYLVGAILADESPDMAEGKKRLRAILASRIGVTPHYVTRPRKQTLVMAGYSDGFGRAKSLLCPFFDTDNLAASCTIWRHREAVCMTYFCKYDGGQRGYDFWASLKWYTGYLQRRLTEASAAAVDAAVVEPKLDAGKLSLEDLEDLPPKPKDYAAWWGQWVSREEEFYLACHAWLAGTTRAAFAENVDRSADGARVLADVVAKYDRAVNKVLPGRLVKNPRMREAHTSQQVVVTTYHRFDSFALDRDLFEVLGQFRATETVNENLARLSAEGIQLVPELIEYLYAAGVLVEPAPPDPKPAPSVAAGELAGRRAALAAILEARGISVSAGAAERIAVAGALALDAWIKKASTASALDDVIEDVR